MNLPLVFIYKFYQNEIQIQQPGKPREQHLGEGTLKFKLDARNRRNFLENLPIVSSNSIYLFLFCKKEI